MNGVDLKTVHIYNDYKNDTNPLLNNSDDNSSTSSFTGYTVISKYTNNIKNVKNNYFQYRNFLIEPRFFSLEEDEETEIKITYIPNVDLVENYENNNKECSIENQNNKISSILPSISNDKNCNTTPKKNPNLDSSTFIFCYFNFFLNFNFIKAIIYFIHQLQFQTYIMELQFTLLILILILMKS
jgi:hypothetical protein